MPQKRKKFSDDAIGFFLEIDDLLTPTLQKAEKSYVKFIKNMAKMNAQLVASSSKAMQQMAKFAQSASVGGGGGSGGKGGRRRAGGAGGSDDDDSDDGGVAKNVRYLKWRSVLGDAMEVARGFGFSLDTFKSFVDQVTAANRALGLSRSELFAYGQAVENLGDKMGYAATGPENFGSALDSVISAGARGTLARRLAVSGGGIKQATGVDVGRNSMRLTQLGMSPDSIDTLMATQDKISTTGQNAIGFSDLQSGLESDAGSSLVRSKSSADASRILGQMTRLRAALHASNLDGLNIPTLLFAALEGDPHAATSLGLLLPLPQNAFRTMAQTGNLTPIFSALSKLSTGSSYVRNFAKNLKTNPRSAMYWAQKQGIDGGALAHAVNNPDEFAKNLAMINGATVSPGDTNEYWKNRIQNSQSSIDAQVNRDKNWLLAHTPQAALEAGDKVNGSSLGFLWGLLSGGGIGGLLSKAGRGLLGGAARLGGRLGMRAVGAFAGSEILSALAAPAAAILPAVGIGYGEDKYHIFSHALAITEPTPYSPDDPNIGKTFGKLHLPQTMNAQDALSALSAIPDPSKSAVSPDPTGNAAVNTEDNETHSLLQEMVGLLRDVKNGLLKPQSVPTAPVASPQRSISDQVRNFAGGH